MKKNKKKNVLQYNFVILNLLLPCASYLISVQEWGMRVSKRMIKDLMWQDLRTKT